MGSPFQTVGRCIYCDSTDPPLTREHVLARGLGGHAAPANSHEAMVLLKATCETCRETTRAFETDILSGMFGPARARLKMGRKDRTKPYRQAQITYRDGREELRDIGIDYVPGAMMLPYFQTAAVFLGLDWRPKPVTVMQTVVGEETRLRDPDILSVAVRVPCNMVSFARMLAKIGLGVAHYNLGPDAFRPIGRDFIRFGTGHPNHYVGGFDDAVTDDEIFGSNDLGHAISLWHHNGFLVATIQLFALVNAPVNYAVVGQLLRLPPGLPHLRLEPQSSRQNRRRDLQGTDHPTTTIQWDQIAP